LLNVVEQGTARRLRGSFPLGDGTSLPIGGKTGTGDHRFEVYSASGQVLESKVMNRTATFAFYLGSRFFGVMTVFVPGEAAADYHFTSAIAVQIVKDMEPALRGLVLGSEKPEPTWAETLAAFEAEMLTPTGDAPRVSALPPPGAPPAPSVAAPAFPARAVKPTPAQQAAPGKPSPPAKPAPARPKPVATLPVKPVADEPTQAPPPPQVDKPDPPPPPQAPPPKSQPAPKEKRSGPWSAPAGEGWDFTRSW
jgi:membrane peptidoglycan carboxypeptidase